MSKLNHNIAMCKVVASKAATLLLCLLASCIFLRAQDNRVTRDFYLYFRVNQSVLDTNYRDNARVLRQLEQFIHQDALAGNALFVYAYASPEGSEKQNNSLSQKRAKTLASYLRTHFPEYIGHIEVAEAGENWTGLRLTYFGVETLPDLVFEEPAIPLVDLPEFALLDTSMPPVAPFAHKAIFQRRPILGVSTNALSDLALTPNVAVEFPLGKKVSLLVDYTFPWWLNRANDMAWQMLKLDIGARWWLSRLDKDNPMDILRGWFVGLDLGAGYYDVEPKHTGYQGEFQTAGIEGGYAWTLGKKKYWRIQTFIGVGWMGTHYRYYEGNEKDTRLMYKYSGRFNWFGPTKVGVSFQYIISINKKKQEQR